ncbi:SHOCT domain-containing protein [Nitrogeniibacter mangrovi]|uniref:SHOCT domain-containing protein n=2 Tax=Nitrogeniibacter mangrovi TaxID=2016596 RepID=A0A6C1B7Q2_9RHOO|nr:SHOCT domain-containing protein [Nitrogeniibacter mangrovi]
MGWNGMGFGMILVWVLLIIALVVVVRGWRGRESDAPQKPIDILKTRYARGEIDKDEFERRRRDIEQ